MRTRLVRDLRPGDIIADGDHPALDKNGLPLTVERVDGVPGLMIVDFTDSTSTPTLTGYEKCRTIERDEENE